MPEVEIRQANPIFFGSGYSAPVNFEVGIRNSGSQPLRVREIEISTPGMAEYAVGPVRRIINDTIAAGEAKVFPIHATRAEAVETSDTPAAQA